ncbi:MAG: YbjN domain-containing protein [Chloroflexota bacterium]|nr:YbjN domain-containing protein [Chloroflexota bacterium]
MAAIDVVDTYVSALPGEGRRVAHGEWGVTVASEHAAGWPLEVGLRLADGLLTARAHALTDPDGVDPWMLLWWNRSTRHARFACTQSREVWVHADLPAAAVDERELDRLLGLVVEGALAVREFQAARRPPA